MALVLSTAIDVDSFRARATLDVATPVVLAVAAMSYLDRLYRVSTPAAHRSAASRPGMILLAFPATFAPFPSINLNINYFIIINLC